MKNWLSTEECAKLLGISPRSVQKACKEGRFKAERIGKTYKISLLSLPADMLVKNDALVRHQEAQEAVRQSFTIKAKSIALARLDLVREWEEYRKLYKGRADKEFVEEYNSGRLYEHLHGILGDVSIRTLYRWMEMLEGTEDWTKLVPQSSKQQREKLNDIERKIFESFLMSPGKIKIGTAIRLTKFILQKRGYKIEKSDRTFRRYAEEFKAKHYDKWILLREGQKALRDKVEPYIVRDPSVLEVGDVLVADGHRLNFQIMNPYTGKPCRATLVGYIDWKSYALCGYEIMLEENVQCIASALRNSVIKLGKIPKVCYQDNGKAFKARFFTGDVNFEEAGLYGLFGRLGIVPVFAQPYNARAKVIERWFKEFSDTFERLLPSFVGSSISDKPAYMLRNEKLHKALHKEYIPTIEETKELIQAWLEFHYSQPCPNVKGKTIGEVFNEGKGSGVDINELDELMMEAKIANIGRNGIRFLGQQYYDDNLCGLREQVVIRYSFFDLSYVKVYTLSGEYICTARRVTPVHPVAKYLGTAKDIEELNRKISMQKRVEKKIIQGAKALMQRGYTAELDWQKVVEISPRISEKLEKESIDLQRIEERIPDEAVQRDQNTGDNCKATVQEQFEVVRLEPLTRPIFVSNIERYEWHLKYGIFTEEDEAWCVWFRTTDEFKMLYLTLNKKQKK